jgi:hypothetical protein
MYIITKFTVPSYCPTEATIFSRYHPNQEMKKIKPLYFTTSLDMVTGGEGNVEE